MDKTVPDQWQYQILARILEKHQVIFVTAPELRQVIEEMKMTYASSLEEAYAMARAIKGAEARLVVIPNGISLIIFVSIVCKLPSELITLINNAAANTGQGGNLDKQRSEVIRHGDTF